ncbi:MAG: hypothetical protein Q7U03_01770 [Syntrophales bacterium]|nr:hypothetical protein [Syntrophales bacterium]
MVKAKKKSRYNFPPKGLISDQEISSSSLINPDATISPSASFDQQTSIQWLTGLTADSTNAPKIGETSKDAEPYVGSYAALIDKHILSKQPILLIIIFAIIGWLFLQDNAAGNLKDWSGIIWVITKSTILLAIFIIMKVCHFGYKKVIEKKY